MRVGVAAAIAVILLGVVAPVLLNLLVPSIDRRWGWAILVLCLIVGGASVFWSTAGTDEVSKKSPAAAGGNIPVHIISDANVVSVNQSGGVTAGTYVNQAPEPELRVVYEQDRDNPDGSHTKIIRLQIVSPYTPGQLIFRAEADGVISGDVHPVDVGQIQFGAGVDDASFHGDVTHPVGRYDLVVTTKRRTRIDLHYGFR